MQPESAACTCRPEIRKANEKPSGPDNRYIGHECSCPLHWRAAK